MNPYHRFHRRFIAKRQGLPGVGLPGGLVSGGSTSSSTSSSAASQTADPGGGIIGEITSLVGGVTTALPSSANSPTPSIPLTQPSSSSTGSTTTSHSTTSASSITSSTSSASTAHATTPTSTPPAPVVFTSSDGTSIVYITSTPAASATSAPHPSFLQNPSLERGVFTLVGLVGLVIIFVLVSWIIRKRRRDRIEREFAAAVSFDPGATTLYERQEETMEKHRLSGSSSGHGHGYGAGYGAPQMTYAPQQEYHPQGYGHHPAVAYCPPPSNPISYQAPPPAVLQPGGANLTRKFSDRKPVPSLFPDPTHDPANTQVPIPPQVYQQ